MGCDIHLFVEVRKEGVWEVSREDVFTLDEYDKKYYKKEKGPTPFEWRSYAMFGFFANVRNYSECPVIAEPRGLPADLSEEASERNANMYFHSISYLYLSELLAFDYDQLFWDRRVTKLQNGIWNGAATADEGEGAQITMREHLGGAYFTHLEEMKLLGTPEDVRIVFGFDS